MIGQKSRALKAAASAPEYRGLLARQRLEVITQVSLDSCTVVPAEMCTSNERAGTWQPFLQRHMWS
jgi:hypothetical protein